jgi:hypothetical protein
MDYAIAAKKILIEGGISEQAIDQATGDAVRAAGSIAQRSGSVRPSNGQENAGRAQTNNEGFDRALSEEARASLLLKAQDVASRRKQSIEVSFDQTVEEFEARSQEMADRIVGDVALSQDETFAIYSGLLADHNEKMGRAMRLSLAVEATPVGKREALAAEAMVEATATYATITDVFSKMVSRYGQDEMSGLGVPISFEREIVSLRRVLW